MTRARISCCRLVANRKAVDFLFFPLGNTNKMTDGPADKVPPRVAIVRDWQLLADARSYSKAQTKRRGSHIEPERGDISSRGAC